ncbi:unnamed protein product [Didymodactylos carnosus]|uniref:Uncharacterized protein n=1 Tax=Didymodactylos carnosus TaxID=1234261 RepID=A0A814ZZN7_9BILA|nr:unnamed protein product [Didymodactylos carnosus]CAF1250315.1 unnamed protein product [Didymodactylos carnosus]CAF3830646.1 unnamed protein product [Didymodactylos carnosus]CAF4019291.1 unnamed protein product [Didymodactylos carnosus]
MTTGFQKTVIYLLQALVNETAINIGWLDQSTMTAIITDINEPSTQHSVTAKCQMNPFSNELENFQWETILVDKRAVQNMAVLRVLGLNQQQYSILQQNIEATDHLEAIYEQCRTSQPKILECIASLTGTSFPLTFDPTQPKAYATLLARVPPREALLITETCGNIDGSTGNPIKNVMFGPKPGAVEHHPISVAFKHGTSQLQLVFNPKAEMREEGSIPTRLLNDFKFYTDEHHIPMNKYAVAVSNKQSSVRSSIDAFVLLSKRSFMPLNGDYQIKTSFPAQITSESRIIDWNTAEDAIECTRIVSQLASLGKLPENLWVLPTLFAAQVKGDDNTTFYIRGGLSDAYSNGNIVGVPKHFTPVTACALTTRNILTPHKTLFESMAEFGFDPVNLFKDISDGIIGAQLHFIAIRWVPDAHTQNVAYLFDMSQKRFAGLLLKDAEYEENKTIRGGKLASSISDFKPILQSESGSNIRTVVSTLYFHHTIYTKHIEPLARLLHDKYQISIADIQTIVHNSLTSWLEKNSGVDMQNKIDISGRYYERNLACKTLKIGKPPYYRLIQNHKLLPAIH